MESSTLHACPPIPVVPERRHARDVCHVTSGRRTGNYAEPTGHVQLDDERIVRWSDHFGNSAESGIGHGRGVDCSDGIIANGMQFI